MLTDQPMREYTSFKIGGPADVVVFPEDTEDLIGMIKYLGEEHIPYFILGNGTNLLVRDGGIRDIVINLSHGFRQIELIKGNRSSMILAEASALLVNLIRFSTDHNLSGLEFAAGIPGTIGGGLVMNAGGSLGELKDVTNSITTVSCNGEIAVKKRGDLRFSYRNLQLPQGSIILSATFALKIGTQSRIKEKIQEILTKKKETQPLDLPNAGSIFKNPEGISAGRLIDNAGLKGTQIGEARVSELHGNFILNLGNATANDILSLKGVIEEKVYQKTGVMLEPEIRIIGEN